MPTTTELRKNIGDFAKSSIPSSVLQTGTMTEPNKAALGALDQKYNDHLTKIEKKANEFLSDTKKTGSERLKQLRDFIKTEDQTFQSTFKEEQAAFVRTLNLPPADADAKIKALEEKQSAKHLEDVFIAYFQRSQAAVLGAKFKFDSHKNEDLVITTDKGTPTGPMQEGETRFYSDKGGHYIGKVSYDKGSFFVDIPASTGTSISGSRLDPKTRKLACDAIVHAAMQTIEPGATFTMTNGFADDAIYTLDAMINAGYPGKLKFDIAQFKSDDRLWPLDRTEDGRKKMHKQLDDLQERVAAHNKRIDGLDAKQESGVARLVQPSAP